MNYNLNSKMPESKFFLIDIFGSNPQFNIRHASKIRSGVGLAFTLLCLGLAGYFIFLFGESLFKRINPSIIQSDEPGKIIDQPLSLFPDQIAFGLKNIITGQIINDPTIITVVATIKVGNQRVPIPVRECLPLNVSIKYNVTQNLFCFDVPAGSTIDLQLFDGLVVQIFKCNGSISCKPQPMIDAILEFTLAVAYWSDVSLDTSNFTHPVKGILNTNQGALLKTLTPRFTVGFKKVEVSTDEALVGTSKNVESFNGLDFVIYSVNEPQLSMGAFLEMNIFSTGKLTFVSRRYQKIQDVVAQVLSVMNIFMFVMALIGRKYASLKMFANLSNDIMDVKYDKEARHKTVKMRGNRASGKSQFAKDATVVPINLEQNSKETSPKNNPELENQSERVLPVNETDANKVIDLSSPVKSDMPPLNIRTIDNSRRGSLKNSEYSMDSPKDDFSEVPANVGYLDKVMNPKNDDEKREFSFKDIIDYMVCKKRKVQEINIAKRYVEHHLDVETIFSKLSEIETIKEIIFNSEQRYLFERIKKPKLRYHIDRKNNITADIVKHYNEHGLSAEKAYELVRSRKEKSTIDQNLLHITNFVLRDIEAQ